MLLRVQTVVHLTVVRGGGERPPSISRSLAELPRLNASLAGGVKNDIHLRRERFSLFFELAHLIFDRLRGVPLVHLHTIRTGRLAFAEAFQIHNLSLDANQLPLKSCELFAKGGDHLRADRFCTAIPGRAVPCITHLRNRTPADISQVVIGPDLFGFLGLLL